MGAAAVLCHACHGKSAHQKKEYIFLHTNKSWVNGLIVKNHVFADMGDDGAAFLLVVIKEEP